MSLSAPVSERNRNVSCFQYDGGFQYLLCVSAAWNETGMCFAIK